MKLRNVLLVLLCLSFFSASWAQTAKDTVNLRDKYNLRQAMYEANQEPFAPPRKNNWAFGIQGGTAFVAGDINPKLGYGFGLNLRKAISHSISLRLQTSMGAASGQNWRPNGGFARNSALNGAIDPAANYLGLAYPYLYYNFRTTYYDAGLQAMFNIGNISFHNSEPKVSLYGFAGVGAMLYNTKINALDANGNAYDYSDIQSSQLLDNRKDILNSLKDKMDDTYETEAEHHTQKKSLGSNTLLPVAHIGMGLEFKCSRRVSLAFEHRVTWSGDDLIDGQRYEETQTLTANADYLQFTSVGINFRIGKGQDSYWFQNPLSKIYSDVRDLKRFNKGDDKDSDNDGVPNSKDKEPGTPEGVMVDVQGRAIDSDGDGLQDFRDKEPFSPKGAEVDKSGVAIDSDGDGVIDFMDKEANTPAGSQVDAQGRAIAIQETKAEVIAKWGMIHFDLGKSDVKQEYYQEIYLLARYLNDNTEKNVLVVGNADVRGTSAVNEQLSKSRAENVAKILVNVFGIDKERVKIEYKGASNLLVKQLPNDKSANIEAFHFINRRVEFVIMD